jgi:hypothetical protein
VPARPRVGPDEREVVQLVGARSSVRSKSLTQRGRRFSSARRDDRRGPAGPTVRAALMFGPQVVRPRVPRGSQDQQLAMSVA